MLDIIALIAAIYLILIVSQIRNILALVFPLYNAKIISIEPPESIGDIWQVTDEELKNAGFEGPVWLSIDTESGETNSSSLCVVYRHPVLQILAWHMMPSNIARPNSFNQFYTTMLEDGRIVTSQVYDVYYEAVSFQQMPAQSLCTDVLSAQIEKHLSFVKSFDSPPDSQSTTDEKIVWLASERMNRQRNYLLDSGLVWKDAGGVVRPKLHFALKLLKSFWFSEKSKSIPAPVPAERLVILSKFLEKVRHAEPDKRTQIGLLGFSILLSGIAGAILWNIKFAVILLAVVIFHELGHYVAMRMFGYKNVHMMALPLVGGVTIGYDVQPSAWRKAWMSLMGPLPGIIVGWLILFYVFNTSVSEEHIQWVKAAVFTLLFVNYLNVLPVLPLDGGHIVQALLPTKYLKMHAVFIVVTCIVGAVISVYYGIYILAVLAFLQLFSVPSYIHSGKVVRYLLQQDEGELQHQPDRLLRIFKAYDIIVGPSNKARQRIQHAQQVLQALETRPMSWKQRSVIGTVYALLLAVPVVLLVASVLVDMSYVDIQNAIKEQNEKNRSDRMNYQRQADTMSTSALFKEIIIQDYHIDEPFIPASDNDLKLAEDRLGKKLPDSLIELYRVVNGFPDIGLSPVSNVDWYSNKSTEYDSPSAKDDRLFVSNMSRDDFNNKEISLSKNQFKGWLYIGDINSEDIQLFISISQVDNVEGIGLIELWGGENYAVGYDSLRSWIENRWISSRMSQQYIHRVNELSEQAYSDLASVDIVSMLKMNLAQPHTMLEKLFNTVPSMSGGADEKLIQSTEQRLGVSFPDDMKSIYSAYNGFPPLYILSLNEIEPYVLDEKELAPADAGLYKNRGKPLELKKSELEGCLVVGGYKQRVKDNSSMQIYPSILWCHGSNYESRYVMLNTQMEYRTITDFVRDRTAEVLAHRQMLGDE